MGFPSNLSAQSDFARKMFREGKSINLLPDFTDSYGVVFRDLNQDDFPDIYVVRFRNLNRFFINEKSGESLQDFTIQSGLGGNLTPRGQQNLELGASAADFDNDGLTDIALGGWGISTRLFRQLTNHKFEDITYSAGLELPIDGNGVFWTDVNLDGNLDFFITDEHYQNHLYIGDGRGNFHDRSHQWRVDQPGVSQSAAFADVDKDGYPDLYVANWFAPDILYRNSGQGYFQPKRLNIFHLTHSLNSNGVSFGDIDNDGDPDLLVTDRDRFTHLYRNDTAAGDTSWVFTDITDGAGIRIHFPAYGSIIADFNQDGWQDIWVNCIGPNMFFLNRGRERFEKIYEERHPYWHPKRFYSTGAACADLDNDGDLDLFVANKDTNSTLYINPLNEQNFIKFKLIGVRSNREAIGAKIWLYTEAEAEADSAILVGFREISGGGGYLSQNSVIVHFGTGSFQHLQAHIHFPGGREKWVHQLSPGNTYVLSEEGGILKAVYRGYHFVYRTTGHPHFWLNLFLFLLLIALFIGFMIFAGGRYRWTVRQLIAFFTFILLLLYGIFFILQSFAMHYRLLTQVVVFSLFFSFISIFMEKIRRLELRRAEYRKLLMDFSQELILIKKNDTLFQELIHTIGQTVNPQLCAIYVKDNSRLIKAAGGEQLSIPESLPFSGISASTDMMEKKKELLDLIGKSQELPYCEVYPIGRAEKILGFLVIGMGRGSQGFTPDDEQVFRTLAAQTAIAMENNLYIEETRRLTQKITESEIREKYVKELEEKNRTLQNLYRNLQETQAQLIQSEKMASLGQLVAGLAHELNNPISYVYANLRELQNYLEAIQILIQTVRESAEKKKSRQEIAEIISRLQEKYDLEFIEKDLQALISDSIQGSQRVKELVLNLRNFSRLDEAELKDVDLHEGLESTLILLSNEIKNRIVIHKKYGKLPAVKCHPGHLNQVFMNILLNAIQSIEGRGNIWIETRTTNGWAEIVIRDDGKGIPESIRDKIFDPFFTTKPVGKGTGLGLSISYNIIQNHGGKISVESREGVGTKFIIQLPIAPEIKAK
ncbi:MAG: hypothetical protein Kow0042_12780 [Calditrichia bacterium]